MVLLSAMGWKDVRELAGRVRCVISCFVDIRKTGDSYPIRLVTESSLFAFIRMCRKETVQCPRST